MRKSAVLFLLLLTAPACSVMRPAATAPIDPDRAAVYVFLLPLPPDTARLAIRFGEIAAVREEGSTVPLRLLIDEAGGPASSRERRLAAGALPPGRYAGLAVTLAAASVKGEQGAADLLLPPGPVRAPIPFAAEAGRAVVLSLRLESKASAEAGFRITPAFSAERPPRPAPGLIGLASSRGSHTVTLFDKVSGRITGVIPAGRGASGLAVDAARRRAYVAAPGEDTVEAIGLLEQAVIARVRLRGGDGPIELALTPDGGTLVTANAGSSTVSVIDALPLIETARIPVGDVPGSVLMDRAGRRAYVFNSSSSTITVLDVPRRAVVGTITTDAGPFRGQFDGAGDTLYVIHRSSPYLTVVDPLSLAVTGRIFVGTGATALKFDPRTERIYLASGRTDSIEIYDPRSLLAVDSIPTEGDVSYMAIDDEGNNLYLLLAATGEVRVIRIVGRQTTARADVGDDPYAVVLLGER